MNYISAKEAATKWDISQRRVSTLCSDGRIDGAMFVGSAWIIPSDALKPSDARRKEVTVVNEAKPFLKWAGGKGQLLKDINRYYPFNSNVTKYAEPFVGGGAVLFDILNKYNLQEVYISDINAELINAYTIIRDDVDALIDTLGRFESEYINLDDSSRKESYLAKRARFNELKSKKKKDDAIELAALMIFLNKTCFNGLYRVNRKGEYNVPMGAYKKPLICDESNLRIVSKKLQKVQIICGDYSKSSDFIDDRTFVYFDPPYRPLTPTASFTSYTEGMFNDENQLELAKFVEKLDKKGAKIVVSNSDPKNIDKNDNFFEDAYSGQKINRVSATRMINRNSDARGRIKELLISNFNY